MMQSKLIVGGRYRESEKSFDVINPATKQIIGRSAIASSQDVKDAIDLADEAYHKWSRVPSVERAEVIFRVARLIKDRQDDLSRLITIEEGKTLRESRGEVTDAYKACMYFASEGRRMHTYVTPSEQEEKQCMSIRRPLGVVAIITPWNFPISTPFWGLAPAVVMGNSVIFKPSSLTSLIGEKIAQLFLDAGLPEGVLNLVTGPGATVGNNILNNPKVKAVTFTGESKTGHSISELNSKFFRRQALELGGKNPLIVAKDADLNLTVAAALFAAFGNTGQRCTAASRIIVEESIRAEFTKRFVQQASKLIVGNGLNDNVEMGPLVSDQAQMKVIDYVKIGKEEGAKILTGGFLYEDERKNGFFYPPTVFGDVDNEMRIAQDEIFGPVVTIISAKNIDEAFSIANDTKYGLSSAIYTQNLKTAFLAIEQIEAGVTFVNQGTAGIEVTLPYGGVKESGIGKELGEAALEQYTEMKAVYIDYSLKSRPWFYSWKE
ncbi:MAG: aldehyde dehydrogenase family protein [archaeon]|nr:aldehyde dehydrogenase family protein [archaeon]